MHFVLMFVSFKLRLSVKWEISETSAINKGNSGFINTEQHMSLILILKKRVYASEP